MFDSNWMRFPGSQTYLTINSPQAAEQLDSDLPNFIQRNLPAARVSSAEDIGLGLSLQRIDDIYLNPLNNFGAAENSTTRTVLYGLIMFCFLT